MRRQLQRLMMAPLAALCASCMVGPNYQAPAPPAVSGYTYEPPAQQTESTPIAGGESQRLVSGADVRAQWWTLFKCPELDELIAAALANHPSLQAAQAALRQAQENFNAEHGQLLVPSTGLGASASRQRDSGAESGAYTVLPFTYNVFTASLNLSYVLDLFGKERRNLEALAAEVDYQRFQVEATYLALTSNVVITVIAAAASSEQIAAADDIIAASQAQLELVERQFALGSASRADVLAARADAAATQALLPPLEQHRLQQQHQLAALTGRYPGEVAPPNLQLAKLALPGELPLSLPSEFIKQRPDIRAQEALLHAANARIGVATADLFPRLDISGGYGSKSGTTAALFDGIANSWQAAAGISMPLVEGGSLRARRRAAIAAHDEAVALYRQTVLQAFADVADTLTALQTDARAMKIQYAALQAAQQSLDITRRQYETGAATLSMYLLIQRQYQEARMNYAQVLANRHQDTAALFQSLGGGWWNRTE